MINLWHTGKITPDEIEDAARRLAKLARKSALVLSIDQRPAPPLAMGHHQDIITVAPLRVAGRYPRAKS